MSSEAAELNNTMPAEEDVMGCQKECEIMGESATCQSRITWTEMRKTKDEDAPCPAAHVVVLAQCESCGECLFQSVKCLNQRGISHDHNKHTFMYKFDDTRKATLSTSSGFALVGSFSLMALGLFSTLTALAMMLVRQWRRGGTRVVHLRFETTPIDLETEEE